MGRRLWAAPSKLTTIGANYPVSGRRVNTVPAVVTPNKRKGVLRSTPSVISAFPPVHVNRNGGGYHIFPAPGV
jgi:hypothetical protein